MGEHQSDFCKNLMDFIKSPLQFCLISQISVHSLWHVCKFKKRNVLWQGSRYVYTYTIYIKLKRSRTDLAGVQTFYMSRHDKSNKMSVRPAKTQISLGIPPVWSESSLSAWRNLGSLATHWVHSEDSDQIRWMPRLIWGFAGRTLILLVLSCRGSYDYLHHKQCWLQQQRGSHMTRTDIYVIRQLLIQFIY